MYIPCQIVETSTSLESQASSGMLYLRGLFCPCLSSQRSQQRSNNQNELTNGGGGHSDDISQEDPELLFSRHRIAHSTGQKYVTKQNGLWNVQNASVALPPLPQMGPPPLPPRKLSSFFPPMEKLKSRRNSKDNGLNLNEGTIQVQVTSSAAPNPFRSKQGNNRFEKGNNNNNNKIMTHLTSPPPLPKIPTMNMVCQMPRGTSGSIACPYLSPVDVVETSWEWDFGKNETLCSQLTHAGAPSGDSEHDSGATDKINIWGDPPIVKKGLLMQQREKIWSRWRERYFILTRDYLHCFRRLRNVYRLHITLSAMGQFIYKLRLANVEDIRWDVRRGGSQICLTIRHEPTILLRSSEHDNVDALYHWYSLLQECICMSKIRRQAIRVFNTSSEEDTNSTSTSNPSRFSQRIQQIINDDDGNSHSQDNSSYTLGTSSGTSGGSSSQADILELYQRRLGGRQSVIPLIKTSSSSAACDHIIAKSGGMDNNIIVPVHQQYPSSSQQQQQQQQRRPSVTSPASSSCGGFYLHEQRPSSTVMGNRPNTQHQLFKRFQLPLPALDSESEVEESEMELRDILEGHPSSSRVSNREPEVRCEKHPNSVLQGGNRRIITIGKDSSNHQKEVPSSPFYDIDLSNEAGDEAEEEDDYVGPVLNAINGSSQSRCESRLTLREFVQAPWRSSSACLPAPTPTGDSQMLKDLRETNSSRLSHFPVPARRPPVPQRPMSSFSRAGPPQGVFGGRKVLPTPWTRNNSTLQIGKGAAFSRSNVIVCPSKLSADVTYLRRV